MIKWTLILQGVPPTKFGRAKKSKIRARFLKTFDFDRECLRNASTCRKSEYHLINYISSPIERKKFGELWSTDQKVIDAYVDTPNCTFSGDYNSAIRGANPSNLYTTYNSLKCISSRTRGAGRPHVGLCPIFLVNSLCLSVVM